MCVSYVSQTYSVGRVCVGWGRGGGGQISVSVVSARPTEVCVCVGGGGVEGGVQL